MCNNVYVECVPVPIVICSDLPSLTNGDIDYGGAGSPGSRPVDTVATFTCNTGFTLSVLSSTTRTCGSDGVWTGSPPICQSEFCNSCTVCVCEYTHVNTITRHLIHANFQIYGCEVNVVTLNIEDLTHYTVNTEPTTCPDLIASTSGMIIYSGETTNNRLVNTIATYTCDNGYTLTGGSFRVCQRDGTWDGTAPTCQC